MTIIIQKNNNFLPSIYFGFLHSISNFSATEFHNIFVVILLYIMIRTFYHFSLICEIRLWNERHQQNIHSLSGSMGQPRGYICEFKSFVSHLIEWFRCWRQIVNMHGFKRFHRFSVILLFKK